VPRVHSRWTRPGAGCSRGTIAPIPTEPSGAQGQGGRVGQGPTGVRCRGGRVPRVGVVPVGRVVCWARGHGWDRGPGRRGTQGSVTAVHSGGQGSPHELQLVGHGGQGVGNATRHSNRDVRTSDAGDSTCTPHSSLGLGVWQGVHGRTCLCTS
jgi:hypothetical protein